jgi:hypothetical protein
MARKQFTRRFTPSNHEPMLWLVLVGDDGAIEHWERMCVPDESFVRRKHLIPQDVPVLIGRP